ncbi:LamG domain-containing protein [Lewinella cohaerens]|uniref:LamG domain-containing protein n=1 Tax=Lewinella cohaerens TaxID=70995 RepID=UPI000363B9DC|nr:LamG domain-containing protein [Lewinella cohaerens]
MRTTTLLLGLALLLLFSITPSPDLSKGLVAYFTFNECDARDDSGQGSAGQLIGNVRCWCGVEDDGLLLDGQQAHVVFSGTINDYFTTSDFTLSFYIKPEAALVFPQSVISKREACDDFHLLDIALDTRLQELTTDFKETENKLFKELGPALPSGSWLHYTLVREGVYARTYINGRLIKTGRRCSGIDLSNDAPFSIGNSPCVQTGRMRRFRGVIDELRVYDRALTDDEVQWLYEETPVENAQMDCVS